MLFGLFWIIVAFVVGIAVDQAATRAHVPVKTWLSSKWSQFLSWVKAKFKPSPAPVAKKASISRKPKTGPKK